MLLAFDIGNSQTEIAFFPIKKSSPKEGNTPLFSFRINTKRTITEDELAERIISLVHSHSGENIRDKIKGIICSSVVPSMDRAVFRMGKKYFGQETLFVSSGLKLGISILSQNPNELGADRIVNAVAVSELYGSPAIIVDFGTAITYCVVDEKKAYLGGIIAPGVKISIDALSQKAEKLPAMSLRKADKLIGKNTKEAITSGVYFSAIAALEGIVYRIRKEDKLANAKVVATGGISSLIYEGTKIIDILDTQLTLKGLEILFRRNNVLK